MALTACCCFRAASAAYMAVAEFADVEATDITGDVVEIVADLMASAAAMVDLGTSLLPMPPTPTPTPAPPAPTPPPPPSPTTRHRR